MCEIQPAVRRLSPQKILIFGGTTEGRLLAGFCAEKEIPALVCVVSDYGRELVPDSPWLEVREGAMEAGEMTGIIRERGISLVVDATHPYAETATANIRSACMETGAEYLRCVREKAAVRHAGDAAAKGRGCSGGESGKAQAKGPDAEKESVHWVRTPEEAAAYLKDRPGNILVTTGSKELPAFSRLLGDTERIYARVLPSVFAVEACGKAGIRGRHLICMQGPFSVEMNEVLIRETGAEFLLTKEAGKAGGFGEKLRAAENCGITCVVIGRPSEEEGKSPEEVCRRIEQYAAVNPLQGKTSEVPCSVVLAGIGPGAPELMTREVVRAIRESRLLLGAPRALKSAEAVLGEQNAVRIPCYLPSEVWRHLETAGGAKAAVLFSGDTGFYSGAKALAALLREKGIPFQVLPGLSSVSYFAARLGIGWEDAKLCTAHGRPFDIKAAWETGEKRIFLLLGGENGAGPICEKLCEEGLGDTRVTVGENLSYPDERIRTGTAEELKTENFGALGVMLMERTGEESG